MTETKNLILPLTSPKFEKEFSQKYKYLENLKPIYTQLSRTWAFLNGVLHSKTLDNYVGSNRDHNYTSLYYDNNRRKAITALAKPSFYFNFYKDKAEIGFKLPPIELSVNYKHMELSSDSNYQSYYHFLSYFIGNFSLPTQYEVASYKKSPLIKPVFDTRYFKPKYRPISDILASLPAWEPHPYWDGPENIKLDKPFEESFDSSIKLSFSCLGSNFIQMYDSVPLDTKKTPGLRPLNSDGRLYYNLFANVTFEVPLEYALWMTNSESLDQFSPKRFVYLMNCRSGHYAGSRKKGDVPDRVGSLLQAKNWKENRVKHLGLNLQPRINCDGYSIMRDGSIIWINSKADNVEKFDTLTDKLYNSESRQVISNEKITEVHNISLYTDWLNNKCLFTGLMGQIESIDLTGCVPLNHTTICDLLDLRLDSDEFREFFKLIDTQADKLKIERDAVIYYVDGMPDPCQSAQEIVDHLICYNSDFRVIDIFNGFPFKNKEDDTVELKRKDGVYNLIEALRKQIQTVYGYFNQLKCAYSTKINNRIYFDIFKKYGPNYAFYERSLELSLKSNQENADVPLGYQVSIPNVPALTSLMPHQVEALYSLDSDPVNGALDIHPGGGKSIILIAHFLRMLEQRLIRRPLIIVPNNLVKEMLTEGYSISGGKLNVVILRQDTVDRFLDTKNGVGFSVEKLIHYIKSAPINTVFVTTYSFLKGRRDLYTRQITQDQVYANTKVKIYPNVELLLRCDFDVVALDESQKVANQDSQQSTATARLVAGIPRKLLSSGTLIRNNPTDLIGQTSVINPRIFRSKRHFLNSYTIDGFNGKSSSVVLAPGAEDKIQQVLQKHIHRISKKRRDWAFLLPVPKEKFHFVEMTEQQQTFYQAILSNALDEIYEELGDVVHSKYRTTTDANKIEEALKRHLQKVEKFLVAPDSNEAFLALPGLTLEDKVSPKVKIVNRILKGHFGKGDPEIEVESDPDHKVIVYGYHRVASEHMFRHLELKGQALHYRAGDDAVITRFRKDPRVKILVADELSLREGLNLQIGSKIIRLQTLWTPGDQEQSRSRVDRPDPRGLYKRAYTTNDWILVNQSLEVAKTARLITKIIDKARVDEVNNPSWRKIRNQFEQIDLIKMDLNTLKHYQTQDDLEDHFNNYKMYKEWHTDQFNKARLELQRKLEDQFNKKIKIEDLRNYAMHHIQNDKELSGSHKIYTPWVPGSTVVGQYGVGLEPLELLITEDEDGHIETEASGIEIKPGSVVETEFGLGCIKTIRSKTVTVIVPGYDRTLTLPKSVVFSPITIEDQQKLTEQLESGVNERAELLQQLVSTKLDTTAVSEIRQINYQSYQFKETSNSETINWMILKPKSVEAFRELLELLRKTFAVKKVPSQNLMYLQDKCKEYNNTLVLNKDGVDFVKGLDAYLPFKFTGKNCGTYKGRGVVNCEVWIENSILGIAIPIDNNPIVNIDLERLELAWHSLAKVVRLSNIDITKTNK